MSNTRPWLGRKIHFIGIGGSGMSGLALVAHRLGAIVSGSDQEERFYLDSLRKFGVTDIHVGHAASNVPEGADIVFSSAIRPDSRGYVERQAAQKMGLRELHRSELLAEITKAHHTTIAVAGAHGKTTTAGMIAHILEVCGKDPSYIIGGLLLPPAAHARAGNAGILVIEADESDKSLLNYKVDVAVITSVDIDHVGDAGSYHSIEDVAKVMGQFAKDARDVVVNHVAADIMKPYVKIMSIVTPSATKKSGEFTLEGHAYATLQPGWHNIENAATAAKVALLMGCEYKDIEQALRTFPGVAGRFELRGTTPTGAKIYDDYAHHPVEVAAAVTTGRSLTDGKVFAVFQPHLFSRTKQFMQDFAEALASADYVFIEPVYAARENPADWQHVSSQEIVRLAEDKKLGDFRYSTNRQELAQDLIKRAGAKDVILLIGAGDVGNLAKLLVR